MVSRKESSRNKETTDNTSSIKMRRQTAQFNRRATIEEEEFHRFRMDSLTTSHHASTHLSQKSHITQPISNLSSTIKRPPTI